MDPRALKEQHGPIPDDGFRFGLRGGEFINHDVAGWLQARDIAQTRSRPYQKNDQPMSSLRTPWCANTRSTGAMTPAKSWMLNRLSGRWRRCGAPPRPKPVGYTSTVNGRRKRIYDKPATHGSACRHHVL